MAQVSNAQSRTLRILGSLSDDVKNSLQALEGCVVLEKVSNDSPKTFVSASDSSKVIEILNTNNLLFRPHFYSLFVKFNTELKVSETAKLNAQVVSVVPDVNISYSRVDENGHTGKVVVDRFDDYNTLRASTGDVTFYKFNRTKAQVRGTGTNSASASNQEGWKTVNNRTPRAPRTTTTTEGAADGDRAPRYPRTTGGGDRTPRYPRTTSSGEGGDRAPRYPRTTEDGDRAPRYPRTTSSGEGGDRAPRYPRTTSSGEGGDRAPRYPRTTEGGDRAPRAPRTTQGQQNGGERRTSGPNSWAGRTGSRGAPSSSSAAPSSAPNSSSAAPNSSSVAPSTSS